MRLELNLSNIRTAALGLPRIGPRRELKAALERYWSGVLDESGLLTAAASIRAENWRRAKARGIDVIPSNDFSLYDHVLDTIAAVGAIPEEYRALGAPGSLASLFAMARGVGGDPSDVACGCGGDHRSDAGVPAMEMTKWFDTNYHFIVPELSADQRFALSSTKAVDEFVEARELGIHTRPVLLGPVTFLLLAKTRGAPFDHLSLLPGLLSVYVDLLARLLDVGADWVQVDEPALALDLDASAVAAYRETYEALAVPSGPKLMLATYFGGLGDNEDLVAGLPVAGVHLDLVRAPEQLASFAAKARADLVLSLGIVDGRNVWRSDLAARLDRIEPIVRVRLKAGIEIAPSCSLLHVPQDLDIEADLDPEIRDWLAFASQKLGELSVLAQGLANGRKAVAHEIEAARVALERRRSSSRVRNDAVRARMDAIGPRDAERHSPFATRRERQRERLRLPSFPTTTIGSFPQTAEVRRARADFGKGRIDGATYEAFLRGETARAVAWQDEAGLDVLVHGEFERNDMVQYFGERLSGFALTRHAWVQSYGSRCVRPPILFGDVSRPDPMTVEWWAYAQSLTGRPMKGMLTGPVTILNWSFVRDDLSRAEVCRQVALAIREEVLDLERAGAAIVQIDEAALREGLPLRRSDWQVYLDWAVESFRLAASGVRDETQVHTHMCYSEFNDIIGAVAAMDADVISIETSRSRMELLEAFVGNGYPAEIGPGVWDIHSPRVPSTQEMADLLGKARKGLADDQIWVNPDCGLKTRRWEEVRPAIANMVAAARALRDSTAVPLGTVA